MTLGSLFHAPMLGKKKDLRKIAKAHTLSLVTHRGLEPGTL